MLSRILQTLLIKVCRYTGTGQVWDCAATSHTNDSITRNGVTAFSDWAAGNEVGPNAVRVRELRARPWTRIERLRRLLER